jgi:hypothetical protein
MDEREKILSALDRFTRQRAGLEFGNYGDVSAYRSEQRSITRDLHDFRALLSAVSWRTGIDADALKESFRAFSGRLTWDGENLSYCTGQYFPTEYRKAACAVLASALWDYTRDKCMPEGSRQGADTGPLLYRNFTDKGHITAGDWLRKYFRREFGRRIASRYFD